MPTPRVDVLVVVAPATAPHRLTARAHHVLHVEPGDLAPPVLAEPAGHVPGLVGVLGVAADPGPAVAVAAQVHRAGMPTALFADDPAKWRPRASRLAGDRPGRPMGRCRQPCRPDRGDTPLVRLDRTGRDIACHLLAKLEYLNPGGSVKDRPALAMIAAAERRPAAAGRHHRRAHLG